MRQLFLFLLFIASMSGVSAADFVEGDLYVRLNSSFQAPESPEAPADAKAFLEEFTGEYSITRVRAAFYMVEGDLANTYRISFDQWNRADEFISVLQNRVEVVYAEKIPLSVRHDFPNDLGSNTSGNNGQYYLYKIQAPAAWDIVPAGSSNIKVAIVDDACQTTHPELAGVIDESYNVVAMTTDVEPTSPAWDHGTFIAGLISARTNNNEGMASLGRGLGLYPIRITDATNPDSPVAGYEGIAWAVSQGVQVINMSWGEQIPSQTGLSTVINAYNAGIVLVASAGNDNTSNTSYPAGYPHVISVASTTSTDTKSPFSAYGSWIDISAPGSQIWSLAPESTYSVKSGTSFSAPLVAATAGLMLTLNPDLSVEELTNCLIASADNIDLFNPDYIGLLGSGRLNVKSALECVSAGISQYEAWLTSVISPAVSSCNPYPDQQVRVFNNGQSTITSLELFWQLDADFPQPYSWTGEIVPGDAVIIDLPALNASIGSHVLRVNILQQINGSELDSYMANNEIVFPFEVLNPAGQLLPFTENFESGGFSNGGWTNENPNTDFGWEIAVTSGTVPGSKSARLPYYIDFETGSRDYLVSPTFDLSADSNVTLSFEYAYQQRTTGLSDTLIVSVSTDCGQNWIRLFTGWENGSNSFATQALSGSFFLPQLPEQWCFASPLHNCVDLDLSAFDGMTGVRFRFEGANSGGNNIYIDNINLHSLHTDNPPIAGFSAEGSRVICVGEEVIFQNTSLYQPDTLLWFFPGSGIDSLISGQPTISYSQEGVYDVTLVAWNAFGADTLEQPAYITVIPPPAVSASVEPDSVCQGNSATITATGADLYYWPSAPTLPAVFAEQVNVAPSNSANYMVIGFNNGCTDTASSHLTVVPPPTAPVITTQDTILISTPAPAYQWYVNGNLIEGATEQLHVPQVNGNYNVRIYNEFGCSSVSAPANVVWVGIENPAKGNYSIFPNPSSGEARINSPCNMERVEVYSVSGKLVQRFDKINQQSFELKLREPAKGVFIVKIFSCEGLVSIPWVLE
ncbi:MAG: S8 family serine peptidase [Bacteroidetes bacterium]|nr:S8 family serine peptidase [Bacteroidota bacterium]